MRCEKCEGRTEVKESRHFHDNDKGFYYMERRRWCLVCGHRFGSIEIPKDKWHELLNNGS